jgi:acid stress-induced BolA-like protein IbaG/YrbA
MILNHIKDIIEAAIPNSTAYILDPQNDGQHLEALVISPSFEGLSILEQQKMVMDVMAEVLKTAVHAMSLKTFTPAKWENKKNQCNLESKDAK